MKRRGIFLPLTWLGASGILAGPLSAQERASAPEETEVYTSRFEEGVLRKDWSDTDTGVTPVGERYFLGEFGGSETPTLKLSALPEHRFLRLRFRLFALKAADGNSLRWGPDIWQIGVDDGVCLLRTAFGNAIPEPGVDRGSQSFPDESPFGAYPHGTGSAQRINFGFEQLGAAKCSDDIYEFDIMFPHSGEKIGIGFGGTYSQPTADESWGLETVSVSTVAGPRPLAEVRFATLWKELTGTDPVAANQAVWEIVAAGEPVLLLMQKRFLEEAAKKKAAAEELRKEFETHFALLDDPSFEVRQVAEQALTELDEAALLLIGEALARDELNAELRKGLRSVRARIARVGADKPPGDADAVRSRIDHILRIAAEGSPLAADLLAGRNDASGGGVVELDMRSARTRGSGHRPFLKMNEIYQWEFWDNADVSVEWDVAGLKAGQYRVEAAFSCPADTGNDLYRVRFDGGDRPVNPASLESRVVASGEWTTPLDQTVGEITVGENAGRVRVSMQPLELVGGSFANLAALRLIPVE